MIPEKSPNNAAFLWINFLEDNNQRSSSTKSIKMAQVKITQTKSGIDRTKRQKDTLIALGLRKLNQTVVKEETPQIRGMINKVLHLVEVEQL